MGALANGMSLAQSCQGQFGQSQCAHTCGCGNNLTAPNGCDFETGNCGWSTTSGVSDKAWLLHANSTPSLGTGPSSAYYGSRYAYVEASEPTLPGDVFTLESPPFDGYSSTFDVSFAYHMHGLGMGHLYLKGMNATGDWDDLWSAHGPSADVWQNVFLVVPPGFGLLRFEGVSGVDWRSDIAIDAIQVATTTTTSTLLTTTAAPTSTGIEALSADFEGDLGNWTTDGQYKWALKTGRTPSGGTGPSGAYEGQYYVYVEASSPNYPSKTFNLESPTFLAGASARAIYFAYSMIGNTMGSLELQYSTGTNWTELWKVSGDKGSSWLTAAVTVPPAAVALRFQGVTGSSYRSDIGLDSIVASEFGITTPPPLSPTEALTCTFETNLCNWNNVDGAKDWTRDSSGTPSSGTGPSSAHQGSHYIYTEASGGNHNKDFILESGHFVVTTALKLQFYYHMKGTSMGDLTVSCMSTGASDWQPLFTVSGSQGDSWRQAEVVLPMDCESVQLKGHTGSGWSSDITVDDIKVVDG